ncbi:MAG: DUF503 domain-containing protein [Planctomycetes bacterium]|nr:DUF503 domain-containing protein [Planctomycetota bacterium]
MVVGILQVELDISGAESLKDKRRVVSSLKDRLHREHMVSVAEVDLQDDCTRAVLGIALASSDARVCQGVLDHILNKLRVARDCVLADHTTEVLSGLP